VQKRFLDVQKAVRVINIAYEVGKPVGHGPRTNVVVFPEASPDRCSDLLLHAVNIFPRPNDAIPKHARACVIEQKSLFNIEHPVHGFVP
jgi:hypothetical protein